MSVLGTTIVRPGTKKKLAEGLSALVQTKENAKLSKTALASKSVLAAKSKVHVNVKE